tara:strand:+ start:265 stop:387 length:123 start_codon:yes stop_codon:yes gene_type:complete
MDAVFIHYAKLRQQKQNGGFMSRDGFDLQGFTGAQKMPAD